MGSCQHERRDGVDSCSAHPALGVGCEMCNEGYEGLARGGQRWRGACERGAQRLQGVGIIHRQYSTHGRDQTFFVAVWTAY